MSLVGFSGFDIGVRAPLDLGGGDLIARKNYTMPESTCCTNALKLS